MGEAVVLEGLAVLAAVAPATADMFRYTVFLLGVVVPQALGYGSGAPPSSCNNLMPGHGINPQEGLSHFIIQAPSKVTKGSNVTLTLTGGSNNFFKGFIIRAYEGNDDSSGLFQENSQVQPLVCLDTKNSATHTSSSDKDEVKMTWTAPNYPTIVTLNSTVVVNYVKIYLNQPTFIQVE